MFVMAIVFGVSSHPFAQWLTLPLPGTPRTADGKPDLTAAAPRTADGKPDLTGIWRVEEGRSTFGRGREVPFQPWAAALQKERMADNGKGWPSARCLPTSVPQQMLVRGLPFKIIQTPGQLVMLFEEFISHRQIFTDGRPLPAVEKPSWFGYSVGRWEGDTLRVETIGFNDQTWLQNDGYPRTEAHRLIERFRRRDFGHLEVEFTFDDPKAYTKPWSTTIPFELLPDTELMEAVCENEKDSEHLVGK